MARTRQINRLRALLLSGDDADRDLSRGTLSGARLQAICRRRARASDTTGQSVRRAEARRLATAVRAAVAELAASKRQLSALATRLAPALTTRHRLNRGDRQLNRALHDITLTRWRADPPAPTITSPAATPPGKTTPRSAEPSSATSPASSTAPSKPARPLDST